MGRSCLGVLETLSRREVHKSVALNNIGRFTLKSEMTFGCGRGVDDVGGIFHQAVWDTEFPACCLIIRYE